MGFHFRLENNLLVGTVAERFVCGLTAAAKSDRGSPRQVEGIALGIADCEFPFNSQ
jgi:hypothetical protein